jgi:hypothetical protein
MCDIVSDGGAFWKSGWFEFLRFTCGTKNSQLPLISSPLLASQARLRSLTCDFRDKVSLSWRTESRMLKAHPESDLSSAMAAACVTQGNQAPPSLHAQAPSLTAGENLSFSESTSIGSDASHGSRYHAAVEELLVTERAYIADLEALVTGYMRRIPDRVRCMRVCVCMCVCVCVWVCVFVCLCRNQCAHMHASESFSLSSYLSLTARRSCLLGRRRRFSLATSSPY